MTVKLEIVEGVGGLCVYVNDFRVAGPKPWGGGKLLASWTVPWGEIKQSLQDNILDEAIERNAASMN